MSEPTMPDMFDRLTDQVGEWAQRQPGVGDYALKSDRELTDTDDAGWVTVTMKDFKLASISYDDYLWQSETPNPKAISKATVEAVNKVLGRYLEEEILAAQNAALPMAEVHEGLQQLSTDFSVAYEKAMSRLREARP